jgi:hypothetical protein
MSLLGDVIVGSYDYPNSSTVLVGGFNYSVNPFVVDGTVETTLFVGNNVFYSAWDVSFSANSVTLTMVPAPESNVFYSADPFNGPVFTVLSGIPFSSVTSVVANNPDCVPCNAITAYVAGNSLFINWQGAGGEVGDSITINFAPTPDTIPFMSDAIKNANNNLTTLSGISEADSTVSVFDGTKLVGTVTADHTGNWSLQAKITDGIHQFTETATYVDGNTGTSAGVTVYSPSSNKSLVGGSGNDFLIAGHNDTLTGGAGNDTFVFNANFGKNIINDFDVNHDNLAFSHTLFANNTVAQILSQAHDSSAGAVIVVDAHDSITLHNVTTAQLAAHQSDFHFF